MRGFERSAALATALLAPNAALADVSDEFHVHSDFLFAALIAAALLGFATSARAGQRRESGALADANRGPH